MSYRTTSKEKKTIHFTEENFNFLEGLHHSLGAKNFSDTVNFAIEQSMMNLTELNRMQEREDAEKKALRELIIKLSEQLDAQTNRLISVVNTGHRLQARTYTIVKKAEENRETFHPSNWSNPDADTKKRRAEANHVSETFEEKGIHQFFSMLKQKEEKGLDN